MNFIDITNQNFRKLKVIRRVENDKENRAMWLCICECKKIKVVMGKHLRSGKVKTCGCGKKEYAIKHNMANTRFYKIWKNIKTRCNNTKSLDYKNYGGRGISICNRWLNFLNFKADMYTAYLYHVKLYGYKNTSINRINNNGNYELSNCQWSTWEEQVGNTRKNVYFIATSPENKIYISKNQCRFARVHKLLISNINNCLNNKQTHHRGWKFRYVNS